MAFATVAVVEHYFRRQRGHKVHLSEQFLYWDSKEHDSSADKGTWLSVAVPLVESDGICSAAIWPYHRSAVRGNEGQGPPPSNARRNALRHRATSVNELAPTAVQNIRQELLQGRCVAFSIPVFNSWLKNNEVTRTGDIVLPIPGEKATKLGHAMAIVGFVDLPNEPTLGAGRFIIRNSWDSAWATESSIGTIGCGTIPFSYIASYGDAAYSVS